MGHNTMGRVSKAEVMEILAADGGWMTAGAIFNRAPGARELDDVGAVLRGLMQDSEVQEIHGLKSLEYALAGVALPQGHREPARVIQLDAASFKPEPLRSGPPGGRAPVVPTKPYARMPLPAAAPVASVTAPAAVITAPTAAELVTPSNREPKESEMPSSSTKPRGGNGETRQRVADLLAKNPEITPKEVGERLGLSGSTASYHMRGLAKAKPKKVAPKVMGAKAAAKPKAAPRRGKSVEAELDAALEQFGRFAPINRLEEKQAVLRKLADHFPGNVGALLIEISDDLTMVAA